MRSTDDGAYDEGRRDGRIESLEVTVQNQHRRIEDITASLRTVERIIYGLIGAIALIELVPALKTML